MEEIVIGLPEIDGVDEKFAIDNDSKADWAIEKIKEAEADRDRLLELIEAKRYDLDLQEKEIEAKCDRDTSYLRMLLAGYMQTVKAKETKTQKTYQLLSGKLVFKKPTMDYEKDENALIQWLEESGRAEYVQTVKKPKWGEFKKQIAVVDEQVVDMETGEVVAGLKPIEKPGRFEVQ